MFRTPAQAVVHSVLKNVVKSVGTEVVNRVSDNNVYSKPTPIGVGVALTAMLGDNLVAHFKPLHTPYQRQAAAITQVGLSPSQASAVSKGQVAQFTPRTCFALAGRGLIAPPEMAAVMQANYGNLVQNPNEDHFAAP